MRKIRRLARKTWLVVGVLLLLYICGTDDDYYDFGAKYVDIMCISEDDPRVPVPAERFPEHVSSMRANGGIKYTEQYQMISRELDHSFFHSREQENVFKNRYHNIPSYDDTRGCLEYLDDDIHSDYIKANYINGKYT